jgi:hypothetical protein
MARRKTGAAAPLPYGRIIDVGLVQLPAGLSQSRNRRAVLGPAAGEHSKIKKVGARDESRGSLPVSPGATMQLGGGNFYDGKG